MTAIHNHDPSLRILAGPRALARIRDQGLKPEDVAILPGAAGGPKALGIQGLDLALFGEWLPRSSRPRSLIGSSIGSWRFASACLPDPVAGLKRLGEIYTTQRFPKGVTPAEVTAKCRLMLEEVFQGEAPHVLEQTRYHLNIVVVQSLGALRSDRTGALGLGLLGVISANALNRPWIRHFFERIILHDPRQKPPLEPFTDFPGRYATLGTDNLKQSLLASGSIPLVMEAVAEIPGVEGRQFRDGGLTDYHLDLPYRQEGIVLYPHFTDRVIPGWFDKPWSWRRGCVDRLGDVVLLAPSPEYLARLPHNKLPDRKDFTRYEGDDTGREQYWRKAMAESQRLGDEFLDLVETGRLAQRAQPLFD